MSELRAVRLAGAPAGARLAAQVPGSVQKSHVLNRRSEVVQAGGVPYDEPEGCPSLKKDGSACKAIPTRTGRCVGHERQHQANHRR